MRALLVMTLLLLGSLQAFAQDPAQVAGKQCKVVLENDYVRVLHWTVGSQQKTAMHSHPALVTISLSDGDTRFTGSDGKTREVPIKARQVSWSEPETHSSQSLGKKPGELIQVELKKRPDAEMTAVPAAEDPVQADPKHYKVEFQNDRVRVLRVNYAPGEKSVMHAHPANVVVFLNSGQTKMTLPDGRSEVRPMKAGQVMWSDKGEHLPQNVGSKPSEVIVVELK